MSDLLICPTCQKSDQVQKVTGLYNANTKEWVETDSHFDTDGELQNYSEFHRAQTLLGQLLAPPGEPSKPTSPNFKFGVWGFILLIVIAGVCLPLSSFVVIPVIFAAVGADQLGLPDQLSGLMERLPDWVGIAVIVLVCLASLVTLIALVLLVRFVRQKYNQSKEQYQIEMRTYERDRYPAWQRAMERWENMYYCARDETVFVSGEHEGVPVEEARTFINRG
jgi:hypothetical protein